MLGTSNPKETSAQPALERRVNSIKMDIRNMGNPWKDGERWLPCKKACPMDQGAQGIVNTCATAQLVLQNTFNC